MPWKSFGNLRAVISGYREDSTKGCGVVHAVSEYMGDTADPRGPRNIIALQYIRIILLITLYC